MTLDTQVFGDAGACRATGEWMKQAADTVTDAGDVLYRVRTHSEAVWRGEAGEAFRAHLGKGGQDTDELGYAVTTAGDALVEFADDLDTVTIRVGQARQVAVAAGLTVTGAGIEPPGPAPTLPQGAFGIAVDPPSLDVLAAHGAAVAAYERKVAAWREVQATVADARSIERGAHETLARRIREHGSFMATLRGNSKFLLADLATGTAATLHRNATRWGKTAGQLRGLAATARNLASNPTLSAAGRAQARQIALQRAAAARAVDSNARLLGPLDNTAKGRAALRALGMTFADFVPEGGGPVRGTARFAGKLPIVGTGITMWQTYDDIQGGKPAGQAIASSGAGLAASTATTGVGMALVGSAAGGPVTFGIVAAGVGVGMGVSYAMDHWDDIEEGVGDAWKGTKHAVGKVF